MRIKQLLTGLAFGAMAIVAVPSYASAATSVVTESDVTRQVEDTPPSDNWVIYTRTTTPGTAEFIVGPGTPPAGKGSLQLNTSLGSDKVFINNYDYIGKKLADLGTISYETFRTTGAAQQAAALNLVIDFNGPAVDGGFATLVFEPVYNTAQGAVVSGVWQDWTATGQGVWWSTRAINGQCAGATDACDKSWTEILANNPNATVLGGAGINQGSGNEGLTTAVDKFTLGSTVYDFEKDKPVSATSKDQCKEEGYKNFSADYKNQGDCVSSVASKNKAQGNPKQEDNPVATFLRSIGL